MLKDLIKQYTDYRTQYDLESAEMERRREVIMQKVQEELEALSIEFMPRLNYASQKFQELEAQIKDEVIKQGSTEKGARWKFVYMKGRVSWDTQKLDGLILVMPQLAQCRKQGNPFVSIFAVK